MAMQKSDGSGQEDRSPLLAADLGQSPRLSPGQLLKQAREQQNISREQLGEIINLLQCQLTAIEEDRYDRLPGDTFTIGYLRNYARAVGLDPDSVVEAFYAMRPQARPTQVRVTGAVGAGPRRPLTLDTPAARRLPYWGIAATALVIAALWGWQQSRSTAEVLPLTADVAGVDVPLPGGLDTALLSDDNDPLARVELLSQPARAVSAIANTQDGPLLSPAALVDESAEVEQSGEDQLSLRFVADCWVEVRDRDNKVLVAVLKRADDRLTVEGRGPFKVLLGFAEGVEMAYNGEPVEIGTPSGSRSARLIVGNS
jgi:cytoskeleton protein RodZ